MLLYLPIFTFNSYKYSNEQLLYQEISINTYISLAWIWFVSKIFINIHFFSSRYSLFRLEEFDIFVKWLFRGYLPSVLWWALTIQSIKEKVICLWRIIIHVMIV